MLCLLIFGFVLLPKAFTLKCYECTSGASGSCTDTEKQCPTGDYQCGSLRVIVYNGNSIVTDVKTKLCVLAGQCPEGSLDFGVNRTAISTKCCTTDLCNTQDAPDPKKTNPNGKKCFRCDGQTCTGTLNCKGDEAYCASAMVDQGGQKVPMKGCATKTMCSRSESQLPHEIVQTGVSCCEGDYCNSAGSISGGLLILVTPLISLIFLS